MTPLRALELLRHPDGPHVPAALQALQNLNVAELSATDRTALLAALDTTMQHLQPQHAALARQLGHVHQAAQIAAYQRPSR